MQNQFIGKYADTLDYPQIASLGKNTLSLIRSHRLKFGANSQLLDDFLYCILNSLTESVSASDAVEAGFTDAISELRNMCSKFKTGNTEEIAKHPFYPTLKTYADTHPLPHDMAYGDSLCVGIFPDYAKQAKEFFLNRINSRLFENLKEHGYQEKREALLSSNAGITPDEIDGIHIQITSLFTIVPFAAIFFQGMLDQILMSLLMQDEKSGEFVFQRLLDEVI